MYRTLTLTEKRNIQRAELARIKRRKHAAYTAWHFEDKRRGLPTLRQPSRFARRVNKLNRWLNKDTPLSDALFVVVMLLAGVVVMWVEATA